MICHYYNYTLEEASQLDAGAFSILLAGIDLIDSRRTLREFQVADWPMLKKDLRGKIFASLRRRLLDTMNIERRKMSTKDLASIIGDNI